MGIVQAWQLILDGKKRTLVATEFDHGETVRIEIFESGNKGSTLMATGLDREQQQALMEFLKNALEGSDETET
tara:strand:- start:279 stop:497 length:219 start_codon:yes stop_codon:yes gene_type:complete